MDALNALLDGPKARGAFLQRSVLNPPWSLRVEDRAPLSIVALTRGSAWLSAAGDRPRKLGAGDVVTVRGPEPYTLAHAPDTPATVVVGPDQRCSSGGVDVTDSGALSVRTWGEAPGPEAAVVLSGTYRAPGELGSHLWHALPQVLVRPAGTGSGTASLVELLGAEVGHDHLGQALVLDRVLDLLLAGMVRDWLAEGGAGIPGWYRAEADPVVGRALGLMRSAPERPWTVPALAAEAGTSRAVLARRFTALVGAPPMAHLARLRLALGADLLRGSDATLASVARRVGYGSAFAFSAAFKRRYGVSPSAYREAGPGPDLPVSGVDTRTHVLGGGHRPEHVDR
ncbi:AraC family transcriptional regulator [Nocardiopsis coralli]|nr:AraC family transcriptional regulator [Nocardiopsis coralli]